MTEEKDISLIFSSLQSKVEKLVMLHKKSVQETEQLKSENDFLRKKLNEKKVELTEAKEQNKVLKLAKSIEGKGSNTEIKLKINELVREIDKCITLVNK